MPPPSSSVRLYLLLLLLYPCLVRFVGSVTGAERGREGGQSRSTWPSVCLCGSKEEEGEILFFAYRGGRSRKAKIRTSYQAEEGRRAHCRRRADLCTFFAVERERDREREREREWTSGWSDTQKERESHNCLLTQPSPDLTPHPSFLDILPSKFGFRRECLDPFIKGQNN